MSTAPAPAVQSVTVPATAVAQAANSAKPLTAIQVSEQQLQQLVAQHDRLVTQVHATEGAIQATQSLINRLKQEEMKAIAFAKEEAAKAATAVEGAVTTAENDIIKAASAIVGEAVQSVEVVDKKV